MQNQMETITFAEPEKGRLTNRLRAVVGDQLDTAQVAQLASGDATVLGELGDRSRRQVVALATPDDERRYEAIQGESVDFLPIADLDLARAASRSVGRIVLGGTRKAIGTGFLISSRLLLTNEHVTPSATVAAAQILQLDFEADVLGQDLDPVEFALDPATLFLTNRRDQLDYALIAVHPMSGSTSLQSYGFNPLSAADDKHALRDFVNIIQHPDGARKQIVVRENRVVGRGALGWTLYYGADTLPGSSGSPVFNDDYEVIGLHHAGEPGNETELDDGSPMPVKANEAIRASAIVRDLTAKVAGLEEPARSVLTEALQYPRRGPSLLFEAGATERRAPFGTARRGPEPTTSPAVTSDGRITWTIPVELSVRLPGLSDGLGDVDVVAPASAPAPGPAPDLAAAGLLEAKEPDPDYSNRNGYDRDFLDKRIPLPKMSAAIAKNAARRIDDGNEGKRVLDYEHFSIVVHRARRMPIFTAANIDGSRWKDIDREALTALESLEAYEASETWYVDVRLDADEQLSQDVFDDQWNARVRDSRFDRGHMVRREYATWGRTAQRANDDTFHFTNCCPQAGPFNESARLWKGVEDYALTYVKKDGEAISVFTGPVFRQNDRAFRSIKVPSRFWKIVALVSDGKLHATAFVADQTDELAVVLDAQENEALRPVPEKFDLWWKPVDEVEELTGLDFGPLRRADTHVADEATGSLVSLDQVRW